MKCDTTSKKIYIYGESHFTHEIQDKELEIWSDFYQNKNMRHLFIEYPYSFAEFLNIWMKAENDDILNTMRGDLEKVRDEDLTFDDFLRRIKKDFPQTIFHGTDLDHQYDTIGSQFIKYLESNNQKDTEQYQIALKTIEQGKIYHENSKLNGVYNEEFRETALTENFFREFDKLISQDIMGIYGRSHTDCYCYEPDVISFGQRLICRYGTAVNIIDLSYLDKTYWEVININEKDYKAYQIGGHEIKINDWVFREYYRLENAYDDFKDKTKTGSFIYYKNFPRQVNFNDVYVVVYQRKDESEERFYYRSDGKFIDGLPITEEFLIE